MPLLPLCKKPVKQASLSVEAAVIVPQLPDPASLWS